MTPGDVGLISLMLSTIGIFNTITLLALNSAVIKYVSEHLGRGDKTSASAAASRAFSAITFISAPAFAATALISPFILNWAFHGQLTIPILLLLLGVGLIANYTGYYGAVMTGLSMFGTVAIRNIIFFVGSRIPSLAFASIGGSEVMSLTGTRSPFLHDGHVLFSVRPILDRTPENELDTYSVKDLKLLKTPL